MTREEFLELAATKADELCSVAVIERDDFDGIQVSITTGFTQDGEPIEQRLVYDAESGTAR